MIDRKLFNTLQKEFALFREETSRIIANSEQQVLVLNERLAKYENPKNSSNSSVPPSQDPFKKTKSLRRKPDRPQGAQKGHKGSKLKMVTCPDIVVLHHADHCSCCGNNIFSDTDRYDARYGEFIGLNKKCSANYFA